MRANTQQKNYPDNTTLSKSAVPVDQWYEKWYTILII